MKLSKSSIADRLSAKFTDADGALFDTDAALIPQQWGYGPGGIFKKRGVLKAFVHGNCVFIGLSVLSALFRLGEESMVWNLLLEGRFMIAMGDTVNIVAWLLWAVALYSVPTIPGTRRCAARISPSPLHRPPLLQHCNTFARAFVNPPAPTYTITIGHLATLGFGTRRVQQKCVNVAACNPCAVCVPFV